MELVSMLWERGPVTIAEAHRAFDNYGCPVGYPTMQTRLNRLVAKGWAKRSEDRPARYRAAISPEQVTVGHVNQLLDKLVGASVVPIVCHLISERPLKPTEIEELRKLLDGVEVASQANGSCER